MAPPIAIDLGGSSDTQTATFADTAKLTVNGVPARRKQAAPISGGIAAHCSSEMFKGQHRGQARPKAKRWDHRINIESRSRQPSSLKGAAKYFKQPGMINLGGGLPSSQYFPIEYMDIKVPNPPRFTERETYETGTIQRVGKHDIAEGKGIYDLHVALNYCQATGSAQMLRFITEHTEMVHNPPYQDWECTMTVGSTSALDIALRMFTTRGDYVLTEEYSFSSAIESGRPIGINWIGIAMDREGLLPSSLDTILTDWDPSNHDGRQKPWLLYTVPTGQNPTGATQSPQRRKDIYGLAQKHDLYIIEDEPYYFLQMQPYTGPSAPDVPPPASHDEFIAALVPSLLSMDTDGRVMRLDSFAKVIAPGLRSGWITASEQIVERFIRASEVSVQNPAGSSQLILFKLLDEAWGHEGYLDWLIYLRVEYTKRRDNIVHACETYLPSEVASWQAPMAGMFHWIEIEWRKHPRANTMHPLEIEEEIFQAAVAKGTLISKGSWFRAEDDADHAHDTEHENENGTPAAAGEDRGDRLHVRTTFAAADPEQVQEAIKRVGGALRDVFKLKSNGSSGNGSMNGNGHDHGNESNGGLEGTVSGTNGIP